MVLGADGEVPALARHPLVTCLGNLSKVCFLTYCLLIQCLTRRHCSGHFGKYERRKQTGLLCFWKGASVLIPASRIAVGCMKKPRHRA